MQNPTSTQNPTSIHKQCPIQGPGYESTNEDAARDPFSGYDSSSGESDRVRASDSIPTLETVTQPGITSVEPPANLKARLKESYDSIAPSYNQWTLMHRGHRMNYAMKLIDLLREERARRDEARGTAEEIGKHPEPSGLRGHAERLGQSQYVEKTKKGKQAEKVKVTSAAQPAEDPREAALNSITSVSEIAGYAGGVTNGNHGTEHESHAREEPSLLAEAGIHLVRLNDMKALEVGCGDGIPVTEALLLEELNVVGVDMSATQIAFCQAHFPNQAAALQVEWDQKDMMDLQYEKGEFDAIIAVYTLLHLPREEQTVFLARACRWLKPGGLILFNFPQAENEGEVEEHWLGLDKGWVYRSSWGEEKMMRIIEGLVGMKVLVKEVTEVNNPDPKFVWVIGKKSV
ncbi:S-adenosyl-L-methionine-dependent methyltransferase [Chaetomium fimeti]|uniref:S-adenosyl-L-methionine-dependent methyltransferase n=1 Tax=Chaetomium fimeti TaxID=1854472 RepID=A0AAE0LSY0_9PEZI|nr:S-adenosyl-L-methionine-dependent methyltransferase [Chaetomium fimeti]